MHRLLLVAALLLAGCPSAADQDRAKTILGQMDKDRDGAVSRDEYLATMLMVQDAAIRSATDLLKEAEARNRRERDPARLAAARARFQPRLLEALDARGKASPKYEAEFRRYDIDGNGKLSTRELATLCHDRPSGSQRVQS